MSVMTMEPLTILDDGRIAEWFSPNQYAHYLHNGYSVPPWGRPPKPSWAAGVRRCPWCGDLVCKMTVGIPDRGRRRAKRMIVGVEPHADGKVVIGLSDGQPRLLRPATIAHGDAFLVHSEWDCALILPRDKPIDSPFPEPIPRTVIEAIIRKELISALERSGK